MDRLLTNAYNEGLGGTNQGIDDVVEIDDGGIGVGTDENGTMIENLDGPSENNFETTGVDEWMLRIQQQEGLAMGQGEATLTSPQPLNNSQRPQHLFGLPYEHTMPLVLASPVKNNGMNNSQNEVSKQDADQLHLQDPQESHNQQMLMPRVNSIDGLQQFQGPDSLAALNSLLQQHQQQSSIPNNNNNNNNTDASLGTNTMQTLDQQVAALQQQQQPQHQQPPTQQMHQNLQESLLQLQKLQEQQQQIIKNISHTGLVDPNSLLNPLGTLLNTLIGQINVNNNGNGSSNSGIVNNNNIIDKTSSPINNAMNLGQNNSSSNNNSNGTLAWGQLGEGKHQATNATNSFQNSPGMMPSVSQQLQQQLGLSLESAEPLPQHLRDEPMQPSGPNHQGLNRTNPLFGAAGTTNTNINTEFPAPPIIRKTESHTMVNSSTSKKQKPRSFPTQLWDAMMTEGLSNDAAFEWLPDGKSFVVVDSDFFCKEILDRKFKQSKYGSFVRKLHRWGFIRLTSGTGTDCFHHPLFQRSRPELVTQIKCNSRNGKDGKKGHNAYARGDIEDSVQPSLMGVEKFIRAKVVSTETDDIRI